MSGSDNNRGVRFLQHRTKKDGYSFIVRASQTGTKKEGPDYRTCIADWHEKRGATAPLFSFYLNLSAGPLADYEPKLWRKTTWYCRPNGL